LTDINLVYYTITIQQDVTYKERHAFTGKQETILIYAIAKFCSANWTVYNADWHSWKKLL